MAVHLGERFKIPAVQSELTRLVRSDPKAAIAVPEALHFLLADKFDPASRRALQVCLAPPTPTSLRASTDRSVAPCLGCLSTRDCPGLLPPAIRQPPTHPAIRHASPRAASRRSHLLFRPTVRTGIALRWSGLRRAIHLRDIQDLAVVLPPDHLEHEGQYVQG